MARARVFATLLGALFILVAPGALLGQGDEDLVIWSAERTDTLQDPYYEMSLLAALELGEAHARNPSSASAYLFLTIAERLLHRELLEDSWAWLELAAAAPQICEIRTPVYDPSSGRTRWQESRQRLSGLPEAQYLLWLLTELEPERRPSSFHWLVAAAEAGYEPAVEELARVRQSQDARRAQ